MPETLSHWRQIPENALSTVTNGEVFFDHYGKFTKIREELQKGYPEDIRVKEDCCPPYENGAERSI
ncbi:MAG: DUF4037 domain-containing protein [Anaerobutyricum sp.]